MNADARTIGETNLDEIVDRTIRKTNIVLDATVLSALMACGRFVNFSYNLNLRSIGGKSNSLEAGSIVHKFLEVYYGSIINGMTKQQAIGFGMTAAQLYIQGCPYCTDFIPTPEHSKPICGHRLNDFPGVQNVPRESEGYRIGWEWVLKTCEQYVEFYKSDHWVPLEVEVVKGKILYEDEDIRIMWKAKLDLVSDTNQGIFPVDHKSMKARRDNLTLNNQFTGQCLIMETRKVFVNKVGFQTTLKPEEKFSRPPINYSTERLIEWQSQILPYWAKMLVMYSEMDYWPPNFQSCEGKYGNCAFSGVCEANPSMREEELKLNFKVGTPWNPSNEVE